ncbi:MAG: aldo/keto reductase [bacterium]|nr:aldo/keto reductase [bacterium]MBK9303880.1 aldo/keto reductase [bacterium]
MKYRQLGNTGLLVSEIALGCSGYWGNRRFPERKAIAVVAEAFERGVNFFDTGHNYCNFNAEPRLGRALQGLLDGGGRSRLVISTKAGTSVPSASIVPRERSKQKDFSPDYIERACTASITNLGCGYLDIFQLHGVTEAEITDQLLDRLRSMKERGLYRYLGINTHRYADMQFAAKHPDIFDMVLIDFNVLQLDREAAIGDLHRAGLGIAAGTVLAQGHLIKGKIGTVRSAADIWYLARALLKPAGRRLAGSSVAMRDALAKIAEMTPAQAAFSYILENPAIASCVFGTTSLANLNEVLEAPDKALSDESRRSIRDTFEALRTSLSE